MEMIKVALIGIAVVLLAVELKAYKPVLGIILAMAGALLIMIITMDKIYLVLNQIQSVFASLEEGSGYLVVLLKILGVTYLCQFSSSVCKDAGFGNLSDQIQMFGKLYIMLAGMPILLAFIEMLQQL